jgi:phosphate transport system permease protein
VATYLKRFLRGRKREVRAGDVFFFNVLRVIGVSVIVLFILLFLFLFESSKPAFDQIGKSFFTTTAWSPTTDTFSVAAFMYGTLVSSFLALLFALPISVGTAVFLTELCPAALMRPLRFLVEMLAAIPSVVYGLWGIFVLAPFIRTTIQPALANAFPGLPLFEGPPYGVGLFSAGIILAIMIIPTITSISAEVFDALPSLYREGAKALGATEWETICDAVVKPGATGVVAAAIMGLGRAVGETMAVTMVIGNRADISASLFSPAATMSSVIANEYAEANSELHLSSLLAVGFCLLFLSLVINVISRVVIWKVRLKHS